MQNFHINPSKTNKRKLTNPTSNDVYNNIQKCLSPMTITFLLNPKTKLTIVIQNPSLITYTTEKKITTTNNEG